jgi:hypothetical protein
MFKQLTLILRSALFYVGYVLATVVMSFFFILLFPLMPSRCVVQVYSRLAAPYLWNQL